MLPAAESGREKGRGGRRAEVSHTGNSKINFLWLPRLHRGEVSPRSHVIPRPLPPMCYYVCRRQADAIIGEAVTECEPLFFFFHPHGLLCETGNHRRHHIS